MAQLVDIPNNSVLSPTGTRPGGSDAYTIVQQICLEMQIRALFPQFAPNRMYHVYDKGMSDAAKGLEPRPVAGWTPRVQRR